MKKQKENKKNICRGSFTVGTACGECERCKKRGYTPEERKVAMKREEERTKGMPSDRVKREESTKVVIVEKADTKVELKK